MQILAYWHIVSVDGEMIDHELHSPFTYLTELVAGVGTNGTESGSVYVRLGVSATNSVMLKPPTEPVERFLAMLRFEHRDKLAELSIDLGDEV